VSYYNDKLSAEDQIDAEEALAAIVFDELEGVPSRHRRRHDRRRTHCPP